MPAMDAQLLQEIVYVVLDGRHLHTEVDGDFLVREIPIEQPENLTFARREPRLR